MKYLHGLLFAIAIHSDDDDERVHRLHVRRDIDPMVGQSGADPGHESRGVDVLTADVYFRERGTADFDAPRFLSFEGDKVGL